jgi:hypothetical protein
MSSARKSTRVEAGKRSVAGEHQSIPGSLGFK